MTIGVQLYSVRAALQEGSPDDVLERLAAMGYGFVEPTFGLVNGDAPGFRRLLDEHGLTVSSLHGPALGPLRPQIAEAAHVLGADTVVVPAIPDADFVTAAGVARSAERLAEAADSLAALGLRLAYHNHHWELANHPGGQAGLELLAALLPAEVALEVDVYWAAVGGADVPALLRDLGDRVRLLHVKDGPATVDDAMTAVGSGTLAIPEILAASPKALRIVELDRCDGDVFDALAESLAYLKELP
ncbi:sugar phosphate isomerase/epimerase [Hamadaea sp.]|uniref:sugar phosphate isomerase/epimerase family protein n=1 Tax=Hamadaea sp. TaxID=2024425 RepID=UPI0025C35CDA|nr:sugar phosphate isomerase/epimerase [Hamadaea sp.]